MSPDLTVMTERVARLRADLTQRARSDALLAEINDVLTEGFASALTGEAWTTRTEQHLRELIDDVDSPVGGADLRAIGTDHGALRRDLIDLRRELTELWRARDRLRARPTIT